MSYAPLIKPANKLIIGAVESITWTEGFTREVGCKPGHVLAAYKDDGSDDFGVVRSNGLLPVLGICGYEQSYLANPAAPLDYGSMRPETPQTAFGENVPVPILQGANTFPMMWLTRGTRARMGDILFSWGAGEVIPGFISKLGITVMIPFTKKATEFDTAVLIPRGIRVTNAGVLVTTEAVAATIDVGVLSSLASGDADGFIDGASLAAKGFVDLVLDDTTAEDITAGAYIKGTVITSADASAIYFANTKPYTIPNDTMRISYTTSDATVAGYILLTVEAPGIIPVARCQETTDATVEVKQVPVLALI